MNFVSTGRKCGLGLCLLLLCEFSVATNEAPPSTAGEARNTSAGARISIQQYREKICDGSNTCDLVDQVPPEYRTLDARSCMCDGQCPLYGDCCADSTPALDGHQPADGVSEFTCVATSYDGGIYMKATCPPSWTESDNLRVNCESQEANLLRVDALLSTPVTSTRTRVTYRNLFCALCHRDTDFHFWRIGFTYTLFEEPAESPTELGRLNYTTPATANGTTNASSAVAVTVVAAATSAATGSPPTPISVVTTAASPTPPANASLPVVAIDEIAEMMFIDDTNDSFWVWKTFVNDNFYECLFRAILPANLTGYVRSCVPNVIDTCPVGGSSTTVVGNSTTVVGNSTTVEGNSTAAKCAGYLRYVFVGERVYKNAACLACNNGTAQTSAECRPQDPEVRPPDFELDLMHSAVKRIGRCLEIPEGNSAFEVLHCSSVLVEIAAAAAAAAAASSSANKNSCFTRNKATNKACLLNRNFPNDQIEFVSNHSIYLIPYKTIYPEEEWAKLEDENVTFICGSYIDKDASSRILTFIDTVATEILIKVSMLCLILQLLIFHQLPEMKNLSGKNLAAFCVTLFVALFCFDVGPYLSSCVVTAVILHYALLSCFTWMLVMSYDCWLSLYRATKFRTSSGKKHAFKFAAYCVISWSAPLIIVGPAVYLDLGGLPHLGCDLRAGYGLSSECFIFGSKAQVYLFLVPASVMFLGNILFFAHTAYMIHLSQKNTVNPNTRHDFRLYTRLALLMGLTWTLGSVAQVLSSQIIGMLFTVLNMSQGIFIFFGFTFKKKTLKSLMEKNKNNRFLSSTLSTFVTAETTVVSEMKTQSEVI